MKKIIILLLALILNTAVSYAGNRVPVIKMNGNKFYLMYSVKNPETGGYLNEYYKKGESYNNWSEMVGIHHFPNAYSPIDQVADFKKYLSSIDCPSALTFDDKKNSAMIDFIVINDKQLPILMEFNIFKYNKSDNCGSVAVQYAKRYFIKTAFESEAAKTDIDKTRNSNLKMIKKFNVPDIIAQDFDALGSLKQIPPADSQNETQEDELNKKELIQQEEAEENITEEGVEQSEALQDANDKVDIDEEKNDEDLIENRESADEEETNIEQNEILINEKQAENSAESEISEDEQADIPEETETSEEASVEKTFDELKENQKIQNETDESQNTEEVNVKNNEKIVPKEPEVQINKKTTKINKDDLEEVILEINDSPQQIIHKKPEQADIEKTDSKNEKEKSGTINVKTEIKNNEKTSSEEDLKSEIESETRPQPKQEAKSSDSRPYYVINSKEDFYTKPRNYKELKEINDKHAKELKKQKKLNEKRAGKENVETAE